MMKLKGLAAVVVAGAMLFASSPTHAAPLLPNQIVAQYKNKTVVKPKAVSIGNAFVWYPEEKQDFVLQNMADNGITWLRIDISWEDVKRHSPEDQEHWKPYDTAISHAYEHGINVLPILENFPSWVTEANSIPEWENFVRETVLRYPQITHWEIWNEPNSYLFWDGNPDACRYTQLLKSAYTIIKSLQPTDKVLYAGMMRSIERGPKNINTATYTIDSLLCGAQGYFDIYNYHPYTYPYSLLDNPTEAWYQCRRQLEAIHKIVKKPVWVTEVGAPTGTGDKAVTESDQAHILTDGLTYYKMTRWIKNWFVYSWYDGDDPQDTEENFGMFRYDGTPKPAWDAFIAYA